MPTLNIKDPEVYRLAALLAERRHTSMTAVVRKALEESAATDPPPADEIPSVEEIMAMVHEAMKDIDEPFLTDDDLYDEWGLPK